MQVQTHRQFVGVVGLHASIQGLQGSFRALYYKHSNMNLLYAVPTYKCKLAQVQVTFTAG